MFYHFGHLLKWKITTEIKLSNEYLTLIAAIIVFYCFPHLFQLTLFLK